MKAKTKTLLTSLMTIAFASSSIVGATYALFTSESKVNIAVTSGKVKVTATVNEESFKLSSMDVTQEGTTWANGGTVIVEEGALILDRMTPSDKVEFNINVKNESNVDIKYRTKIVCTEDSGLMSGLIFKLEDEDFSGLISYVSTWGDWKEVGSKTISAMIELPYEAGNEYQDLSCKIAYVVEAVQGNGSTSDDESGLIKTKKVETKEELVEAIAKGENIKLTDDIELDSTFSTTVNNDVVIDLGEKELKGLTTNISFMVKDGSTLTFKNGDLKLSRPNNGQYVICVYPNSTVNLDGVNMNTNYYGIFVYGNGATVNIKNSKIETEASAAVTTNGTLATNPGFTVNIEGSTLISGQTGLLLNVPCTVNITDSKIYAKYQGIFARGGTYTITNSTISNTNNVGDVNEFDNKDWGDGNSANRAALTIGNKGNGNSYQYPTEVTLINTVVESVGAYPTVYMYGNISEGNGATLKYDGNCKFIYENNQYGYDYIIQGDNGANTTVKMI